MSWTTPGDLKAQLRRLWERGELLRDDDAARPRFPLRLTLKTPGSAELATQFEAVRAWIAELTALAQIRIEWRELNHRVLGPQRVPLSVWVDDRDTALAFIGKRAEAARYDALLELARGRQEELLPWLARRPLQALALAEDFERLLGVVAWIVRHPQPGVYLRQVDVRGVHSKLIEQNRGVLSEWLDLVLPAAAIRAERSGSAQFSERYGFLGKPVRIRFRVLDSRLALLAGPTCPDVTLDADSFARLQAPIRRAFITENEINFLAFPPVAEAIVVFGAGYGWEALGKARWLERCALHYWGDIDTHGFAILDRLREHFPRVESFLMDRATLLAHEASWGEENDPVVHDLARLTEAERALYDELRDNRIRKGLRLEQERVGFAWMSAALERLVHEND
ncbi:MAG: hypothetical protein GEV05_07605 [Betaproteobacteria bacterium]|nr:hypothetical protein [Betaproteobacteria bacterium]